MTMDLSHEEIRELRKALEATGSTGATNPVHDKLNRAYTDGMSDDQLLEAMNTRADGAPQARAALRRRGYSV
jgi:hypothetical protein